MTRLFPRSLIVLAAVAFPLSAFAEPPAAVTGLQARYSQGQIRVQWDAPQSGADIAYYRVYFSRNSILQNKGQYDDFAITTGSKPEALLVDFPHAPALSIAVLGVNGEGEESRYFTEEVLVDLTQDPSALGSSLTQTGATASTPSDTQSLLSAQTLSATGVLLTFSLPVDLQGAEAVNAFEVTDGSGHVLGLRRLILQGDTITLITFPQRGQMLYTVRVARVLMGKIDDGGAVPLDPSSDTATFLGMDGGGLPGFIGQTSASSASSESPQPTFDIHDIANLHVQADGQTDGRYSVTAQWQPGNPEGDLSAFEIRQSRDGGQTFSDAQQVPSGIHRVHFSEVPAGPFALLVRAVGRDGTASKGILAAVVFPPIATGTVTPSGHLAQSGAGAIVAFVLAGGIFGWRKIKTGTFLVSR
ncbi:hypothetical protein HY285_02095 [Candidatus Peregrinibacteria bacterium]|nr:hypothetical protein [Candidatus Peregrinibacteria bacterium]MBI3816317.1 hypothetical protein [Candidatus Peregrinibacteria bacterium]